MSLKIWKDFSTLSPNVQRKAIYITFFNNIALMFPKNNRLLQ